MPRTALLLASLLVACDSGYSAAATPCDDWCRATQRAGCAEDWPHECVGYCTNAGHAYARRRGCEAEWEELLLCYEDAPDQAFYCRAGISQPLGGVCIAEQSRLGRCTDPVWQSCLEACSALSLHCEEFDLGTCTQWCAALPDTCLQAVAYHDCLLDHIQRCDVLAPECAETRAQAVLCPGKLAPDPAPDQ